MTRYGLAYFLEDKSGLLTGSEFIDIHDRMRLSYRRTIQDSTRRAYMIYNITSGHSRRPAVTLDFGPNNELGTISFGTENCTSMKKYLVKLSNFGSTKCRKFMGQDGNEYRWSWRTTEDQEWTCRNIGDEVVAFYHLKVPGEPPYRNSSGCMLSVEENYGDMACEFLASLMIMRHIVEYGF